MTRSIAVVTVARSDFSILRPVLAAIQADAELDLRLIATGMHLAPEFGMTVDAVAEEFPVAERVEMLLSSDSPEGIAKSTGIGMMGFAQLFGRARPDLLVIMGDRFEMFAAAAAALPFGIPIAHIHGGELSLGAIDDAMRHSITKLSHLHFVTTEAYARRVIQLGEEPWRVTVSGAPALDNLRTLALLPPDKLKSRFGLRFTGRPLVVTYHPVTLKFDQAAAETAAVLDALKRSGHEAVITYPNADTNGRVIIDMIEAAAARCPRLQAVKNMGVQGYYSLLTCARAMVGNSSSGIIEAASFGLPVVNVGDRQKGRLCGANVLHVAPEAEAVLAAIAQATSDEFRAAVAGMENPYGRGEAAGAIVGRLKTVPLDRRLIEKGFNDLPGASA